MTHSRTLIFAVAAALAGGALSTPVAHAQYKTYPGYSARTPSPAYYDLRNPYDRDTYMNPNPFPSHNTRTYEERAYRGVPYPPDAYAPSATPYGFYGYDPARPQPGYYYGPGPFVYGNYGRMGRMGFRYGWY